MTQQHYLDPPAFATGDVLSASKLNHMLTDLDLLYGWYHAAWYGCDMQQRDATNNAATVEGWAGWLVLHGDTLNVRVANFSGNVTASVYFDGVLVLGGISSAGSYSIPLALAANGWSEWTPYRVHVNTVRPDGTGELDVIRVYMSNSTVPSAGTLPAFTNNDTSAAADFNAIGDGIRAIAPVFLQPIGGCRGGEQYMTQGANTAWTTVQSWSIQHRLNRLRVSLFLRGGSSGTVSARLKYDGTVVNGATWTVSAYGSLRVTDALFAIPGSPSIGTFYNVELQIKQSAAWQGDWFVRPDYVYEDQEGLAAGFTALARWTHGDYAVGTGSSPALADMSTNLGALDTAVPRVVQWINMAQREPITTVSFPWHPNYARRVYHVRRWRWLAYSQHDWPAEPPDTDTPAATINWTYDGVTWDSYQLPDDDGAGGYYDLDTSPIAPGMVFYASGVRYAIQTPRTY